MVRFIIVFAFVVGFYESAQSQSSVTGGKADLRNWDVNENPIMKLDGTWSFFWNNLLNWEETKKANSPFIEFTTPWNEQQVNGQELPGKGYATYAAEILLPANHPPLALNVPAVFNSYSLWVNGKLVSQNGKVGTDENKMIPEWNPKTVELEGSKDTLRLIFQVANFQTIKGGARTAIRIGNAETLMKKDANEHRSSQLILLFFAAVGIILFLVGFIRAQSAFYSLSGVSLAFALRFLFSDHYPILEFGWGIPWLVVVKMEYASIPLIVLWSTLLVSRLYPLEFKKPLRIFHVGLNLLLIGVVIIIPAYFLRELLLMLQVVALFFLVYSIYAVGHAVLYRRVGAWVTALGILIACAVGGYNIFVSMYSYELNRIILHIGYGVALILNVISLWYRTPSQLRSEETLTYSNMFGDSTS